MSKKRKTPSLNDKTKRKKKLANDIFKDQLEDLWHLLEKKKRLKRRELITKRTINEQEEEKL
jgi:hypothetical protein|tara:strand:- start:248 stop:433 length:186 start_codon:yes stop_codon:yes gene_type:complete